MYRIALLLLSFISVSFIFLEVLQNLLKLSFNNPSQRKNTQSLKLVKITLCLSKQDKVSQTNNSAAQAEKFQEMSTQSARN